MWRTLAIELKRHAPYTALGTASGVLIIVTMSLVALPPAWFPTAFWVLHPFHVLLSALVTTAIFVLHDGHRPLAILLVGYFGSVGVATVSDCVIPYVGEWALQLPNRGMHLGFIERWWLVNPLALLGIVLGMWFPRTRVAHMGHVLLSTWASLFHIAMAAMPSLSVISLGLIAVFLFVSVWLPCCTSDIIFPLLWTRRRAHAWRPLSESG